MAVITPHIPVAAPSPATVWQQYRRSGDPRLRDRLVFTLAPLVRHAGAESAAEADAGLSALLAAVDSYVPERDGTLETYAWRRIAAALAQPRARTSSR